MSVPYNLRLFSAAGYEDFTDEIKENITGNFSGAQARNKDAVFVVYDAPDLYQSNLTDPPTKGVLVKHKTIDPLPFVVQSYHGYKNQGIILFPVRNYGGLGKQFDNTANVDFPSGPFGVSSFIVLEGKWSLHSEINGGGTTFVITNEQGVQQSEFGPGDAFPDIGAANDHVKSVVRSEGP